MVLFIDLIFEFCVWFLFWLCMEAENLGLSSVFLSLVSKHKKILLNVFVFCKFLWACLFIL